MKNYLITISVFDDKDYAGTPEQVAGLMLEFGQKVLGQSWQNVADFIRKEKLTGDVKLLSDPGLAPFLYISCTERAARQIQAAGLGRINGVLEMTLPFEAPDWHKGLRSLEP